MTAVCAQWVRPFRVAGSASGSVWVVTFEFGRGARCTCPAHAARHRCKHVVRVMVEACLWSPEYAGGMRVRVPDRYPDQIYRPVADRPCPGCCGDMVERVDCDTPDP